VWLLDFGDGGWAGRVGRESTTASGRWAGDGVPGAWGQAAVGWRRGARPGAWARPDDGGPARGRADGRAAWGRAAVGWKKQRKKVKGEKEGEERRGPRAAVYLPSLPSACDLALGKDFFKI
jgi:hypothetical protein